MILYPGAEYILAVIIGAVVVFFTFVVGLAVSLLVHKQVVVIIQSTDSMKRWARGEPQPLGGLPWWTLASNWSNGAMLITDILVIYALLGPTWALLQYLKGI
jgi:hypothetical protein